MLRVVWFFAAFWLGVACAIARCTTAFAVPPESGGEAATHTVVNAVELTPGPTCLDEQRLERRIMRWLGRSEVPAGLRIRVQGGPGPTEARFIMNQAGGAELVRELPEVPGTCGDLHSAVALAIALAIDAEQFALLPGSEQAGASAQPGLEPPELVLPDDAWSPALAVSVVGGVGIGFLHAAAPGVALGIHMGFARQFELRVSGHWTGLRNQRFSEVDVRFDADLLVAAVALCPLVRGAWFELAVCGEVRGGPYRTLASGLLDSGVQTSAYWAASLGVDFRFTVAGPLQLRGAVDLVLPWVSRKLVVKQPDGRPLREESLMPWGVFVGIGPVLRFL